MHWETAFRRKAPGRQNRFAFAAGPQPFGDAVDKQVGGLVLAQVPQRKSLVLPQSFPKLRHRGLRKKKLELFGMIVA